MFTKTLKTKNYNNKLNIRKMKTVKYKTNINCSGCLKSVTPFLNELANIDSWKVDTENPDKILEIELEDDNKVLVVDAVKKAGFEIEEVK